MAVQLALGDDFVVAVGTKHSSPSIEDGVAALGGADHHRVGARTALLTASVGAYARAPPSPPARAFDVIESWHLLPAYLNFCATRCVGRWSRCRPTPVPRRSSPRTRCRQAVRADDPYPDQVGPRLRPSRRWPISTAGARAGSRPAAPPSHGSVRHPRRAADSSRGGRARGCGVRLRVSWPTTSRCCTTSTSKRRPGSPMRSGCPSPAPGRSTTTRP